MAPITADIPLKERTGQAHHWVSPIHQTKSITNYSITPKNIYLSSKIYQNVAPSDDIYLKRLHALNQTWEVEFKKYSHYITNDSNEENISDIINSISKKIAHIPFKEFEIELSPNNCVKYILELQDKKILIITKALHSFDDNDKNKVIFTIFKDKQLILSDEKQIYELVEGINRYFDM